MRRWSTLKENLDTAGQCTPALTVKSLCDTHWSARADAVKALCAGYEGIRSALLGICADSQQKHNQKYST